MRKHMLYSAQDMSRKSVQLREAEQELMKHLALPVQTLMSDIITRDLTALYLSVSYPDEIQISRALNALKVQKHFDLGF